MFNEDNYVSRELGIQLIALVDWKDEAYWAKSAYSGEWQIVPDLVYKRHEFSDEPGAGDFYDHTPAYSFKTVLDHTPKNQNGNITQTFMLGRTQSNERWAALWGEFAGFDGIPQDAVAKLLVQLFKNKLLKP